MIRHQFIIIISITDFMENYLYAKIYFIQIYTTPKWTTFILLLLSSSVLLSRTNLQ